MKPLSTTGWKRRQKNFPMTEWAAEMLDGALVHSNFYLERVRSSCPGPVARLPLAFRRRVIRAKAAKASGGPIRLLTFGVINSNKRVESVLRAIGAKPALRNQISYSVVGDISPAERKRLEGIARMAGVTNIRFHGWVPDEVLDKHMNEADIICCLRLPALEGSSGSVLEAMQSGRPVIVTNTGCYAEIPDGLVLKVRPETEQADLQRHLSHLAESPEERHRMGQQAAAWARKESDPKRYARTALAHFEQCLDAQPLLRCGEVLGREVGLLGLPPQDPLLGRLAAHSEALWGNSASPTRNGEDP